MNNNTNFIQFKKRRELGEILTDTFAFIRNNGKPLLTLLLKTSAIPFILLLIAAGYYTYLSGDILNLEALQHGNLIDTGSLFVSAAFLFITLSVFYSCLFGSIMFFIKEYIKNKGTVDIDNTTIQIKDALPKLIGVGLISMLIISVGFFMCILPGIYFYVPLNLVFSIMVFEEKGSSESISDSFSLIKGEWWMSFATLFIISIIISFIGFIFSLPGVIYTLMQTFTASEQGSIADFSVNQDWVFIALNTLSSLQYVLYGIMAISVAFIYYNIKEKKFSTGAFEEIDSL
ncbi:hypothetical protein ACFSTE_04295 [Aquimarina hainanensis]|uniref:Glycerophosphoryl diester phosphodiesterase membrane domain-containing protein n=1 Tax=Aquimarina hainanensis TaxID=1578017 RepID=A0ABW5N4X2_9FLAO